MEGYTSNWSTTSRDQEDTSPVDDTLRSLETDRSFLLALREDAQASKLLHELYLQFGESFHHVKNGMGFSKHRRVADDSVITDAMDYICQKTAEYYFPTLNDSDKRDIIRADEPLYDKDEVFGVINPEREIRRRLYRLCVNEITRGVTDKPTIRLSFSGVTASGLCQKSYYMKPNGKVTPLVPSCGCCKKSGAAKKCSVCKTVYYCDRECQRHHWTVHKNSCNAL